MEEQDEEDPARRRGPAPAVSRRPFAAAVAFLRREVVVRTASGAPPAGPRVPRRVAAAAAADYERPLRRPEGKEAVSKTRAPPEPAPSWASPAPLVASPTSGRRHR